MLFPELISIAQLSTIFCFFPPQERTSTVSEFIEKHVQRSDKSSNLFPNKAITGISLLGKTISV
jgi:hypothetical protein